MQQWLKKNDPDQKMKEAPTPEVALATNNQAYVSGKTPQHEMKGNSASNSESSKNKTSKPAPAFEQTHQRSRFTRIRVKRKVWQDQKGKCSNCGSSFALQFDHVKPFAKGGTNDESNLRLLCRSCNLHAGIQEFGLKSMRRDDAKN